MASIEDENSGVRQESLPPFAVSGQFMMTSQEKFVRSEDFNPRKIVALTLDDSLARLFECLTLEYSGNILLTPKWKNFRSQNLKFAEKTRINNAIWRSWHIQFQQCQKPLFCQFGNPLAEMAKPPKPMTLMVEGQYWKRKLEVVAAQYKKWRVFYKHLVEDQFQDIELQHQSEEILRLDQEIQQNLRTRERERKYSTKVQDKKTSPITNCPVSLVVSQALEVVDSCNLTENMVSSLPDTLFTSFNGFKERDFSGTSKDISDMMQPTLDTLQPSLEAMTPVLDELIEQLEASMKGSELIWDFSSLDRNTSDEPMGLVQSSSADEQMDHSGVYTEQHRSGLPHSSSASWPTRTSNISTFGAATAGQIAGSSTSGIQPGVQTTGGEMPGIFFRNARGKVKRFNDIVPMDLGGTPGTSSGTMSIDIPHVPSSVDIKQTAAVARLRYSSPAGSIPRNSSDSQLYAMSTTAISTSRPLSQTQQIPIEVQAPNLVAQLKMTKSRYSMVEEKPKRSRIPRNKSAPGLASLETGAQLKKAPQAGGVRGRRLGRMPRNRSDSSLTTLLSQAEQATGRPRQGSERRSSNDGLPTSPVRKTSMMSPTSTTKSPLQHSVAAGVPSMQQNVVTSTVVTPSTAAGMPAVEAGAPALLINEMVKHLLNKGVSLGDILGKLTSLVGTSFPQVSQPVQQVRQPVEQVSQPVLQVSQPVLQVSQPVLQVTQPVLRAPQTIQVTQPILHVTQPVSQLVITQPVQPVSQLVQQVSQPVQRVVKPVPLQSTFSSIPSSSVSVPMEAEAVPVSQNQFISLLPNTTVTMPTPKTTQSRSRRKNVTRRVTSRTKSDSTAVVEESTARSTDDIIHSLLAQSTTVTQTRPAIQPQVESSQLTTIDTSVIHAATTVGSIPLWGNPTASIRSPVQRVTQQNVVASQSTSVAMPTIFSTAGDVMVSSKTMDTGLTVLSSSSLTGLTPSMTPPMMTSTVGQATPSSRTTTVEASTSSAPVMSELQARNRPMTKTLPKEQYIEHRRMVHVSAEQKRRGNIKMGFEQLIYMVPSLASQGNNKISKASVLKQSVDYILQVQRERDEMGKERERLQKEIDMLHHEISICQQLLPATGVMVNRNNFDGLETLFNQYISERTQENPKFWIFNVIFRPLFDAYSSTVTSVTNEDFFRTVLSWFRDSCSLPKLRPSVLTSLRELIKSTSILTDPSQFPKEAVQAASALEPKKTNNTPR